MTTEKMITNEIEALGHRIHVAGKTEHSTTFQCDRCWQCATIENGEAFGPLLTSKCNGQMKNE